MAPYHLATPPSLSNATGDQVTFTPASPGKRLRALLRGSDHPSSGSLFIPADGFILAPRSSKPSGGAIFADLPSCPCVAQLTHPHSPGFNPQNGTVTLNTSVFLINVGGAVPPISPSVRATTWHLGCATRRLHHDGGRLCRLHATIRRNERRVSLIDDPDRPGSTFLTP